jgi:hypothetical protein
MLCSRHKITELMSQNRLSYNAGKRRAYALAVGIGADGECIGPSARIERGPQDDHTQ